MATRRAVRLKTAVRLINRFEREAEKCRNGQAFFAGCVMAGAALEAMLLVMTRTFPHQLRYRGHRVAAPKMLGQIVRIAEECRWLDKLGLEHAQRILEYRNRLHADRVASKRHIPTVTRSHLDARLFDLYGVYRSLRRYMMLAMARSAVANLRQSGQGARPGRVVSP